MEFFELIEKRYSVRAYKPDPVEDEKLTQVLEAARLAPTAADKQPFKLIVIRTHEREGELRRIYARDWFVQAPLIICACGIPAEGWIHPNGKNHYEIDTTIVMDHLTLAAANVGLGTCWVAAFDVWAAREVLHLPVSVEPVIFTPLGYPADEPGPKVRKPLSEIVRYERW
jgi:nitroreductase